MEEMFAQLSRTGLWAPLRGREAVDSVNITEIWRKEGSLIGEPADCVISNDNLDTWLCSTRLNVGNAGSRSCILTAVWIQLDSKAGFQQHTVHCQPVALEKIINTFGLDLAYKFFTSCISGPYALPIRATSTGNVYTYSVSYHPKLALLWSWDAEHETTNAVFFAGLGQIEALKKALMAQRCLGGHPMLPVSLVAVVMSQEINQTHDDIKRDVRRVEVRTGYHRFGNRFELAAEGELAELSAKMCGSRTKLASATRKSKTLANIFSFITENTPLHTKELETNRALTSIVTLLRARHSDQAIDNDFIIERVETQIHAVRI
jgi:hypothetical protein